MVFQHRQLTYDNAVIRTSVLQRSTVSYPTAVSCSRTAFTQVWRVRIVAQRSYYFHVRLSSYISAAPTGRISVKFDIYMELILTLNPNLIKIGQKYRALHVKT
jgi:hypothetical protein